MFASLASVGCAGMGFGTLLVIVLAGIGGPLLGLSRRHSCR
jgi:hypothetical protein